MTAIALLRVVDSRTRSEREARRRRLAVIAAQLRVQRAAVPR
jgi:hypothetical protein